MSCWFYCVVWNNVFFKVSLLKKVSKIYFLKQETEQCALVHCRQGDITILFKTPPFTTTAALNTSQCDSIHIAGTSCLIMAIVILSLTLPVLCSRHDLSMPTYGLQHKRKKNFLWRMVPRKRVGKNPHLCQMPPVQCHSFTEWDFTYHELYCCGQCVFSCRLRTGTRHPGFKGKFPISDPLTDNILGYATLWFPLLGSVQPLHMKFPPLEIGIKNMDCQFTYLLVLL